jgi:hypothetical protein
MASKPPSWLKPVAEAAELMETTHGRWAEAETHSVNGSIMQLLGENAASERCYQQALDVARLQMGVAGGYRPGTLWQMFATAMEGRSLASASTADRRRTARSPVTNWGDRRTPAASRSEAPGRPRSSLTRATRDLKHCTFVRSISR